MAVLDELETRRDELLDDRNRVTAAAWGYCLFGTEAMSRWLRTNADYEPEVL